MTTPPGHEERPIAIEDDEPVQLAEQVMAAVMHGESALAVLGDDGGAVLAVVDDCVRLLADQALRIVRFRGAPGAPVTLQRIVQELGTLERGGSPADEDELIVHMLAKPYGRQGRMLLVFEQAELLPLRTLAFLQIISTVFGTATPGLQLLFAGQASFLELIENDELTGLHDRLETIISVPGQVGIIAPQGSPSRPNVASQWKGLAFLANHKSASLMVLLGSIAVIGAAIVAWSGLDPAGAAHQKDRAAAGASVERSGPSIPGTIAQSTEPQPARPPGSPAQPTTPPPYPAVPSPSGDRGQQPATPTQPAKRPNSPTGERLARLQGDFETFLAQTAWGSKRPSDAERARLFSEFLQWNYGKAKPGSETSPQPADGPALSRARVTLQFLAGSASGKGVALELATALRTVVALARTRPATSVPNNFELRYFAQEDEGLAVTLAQILQTPEAPWTTKLMPSYRPAPLPHTIELWIPLR